MKYLDNTRIAQTITALVAVGLVALAITAAAGVRFPVAPKKKKKFS